MDEKPSLEFLSPRHWLMDFKMVSRCNSSLDLRGGYGSTAANSPSRGCPSASRYHHVTITCRQVLPRSSYLTLPQSDTPRLRRIPFSSGCSYTSTTGGRRSHLKYSGATHMVFQIILKSFTCVGGKSADVGRMNRTRDAHGILFSTYRSTGLGSPLCLFTGRHVSPRRRPLPGGGCA